MENLADNRIRLGHKVTISAGGSRTLPGFCRHDWVVRAWERDVGKVRLFGFGLVGDPLRCLAANIREDALKIPVFQARPRPVELKGFLDMGVGDADGFVILDVDIRREVRRIHAKPGVKSALSWAILNGLCEVDIAQSLSNGYRRFAIFCLPGEAEVPLTKTSRCIAVTAKQKWDVEAVALKSGCSPWCDDALFEDAAPRIASGEEAIACWRANGCGRVGIGCPDATGGKLVDVRRRDFGCRVVAGDVAVAQVIREDDNDVWSVRSHVSGVHRMEGGFL